MKFNLTVNKFIYNKKNLNILISILTDAFGKDAIDAIPDYIDSIKDYNGKFFKFIKLDGITVGCYEFIPRTYILKNFCIIKKYQRQGIGTWVMNKLREELNGLPINIVDKPDIIEFYENFPPSAFYWT